MPSVTLKEKIVIMYQKLDCFRINLTREFIEKYRELYQHKVHVHACLIKYHQYNGIIVIVIKIHTIAYSVRNFLL